MLFGISPVSRNIVIPCPKGIQVPEILDLIMQFLITACKIDVELLGSGNSLESPGNDPA